MGEFSVDDPMSHHRAHGDAAAGCWAVARKVAVGLMLAIVCQCALGQAMYRIKSLRLLEGCKSIPPAALGLNGADQVTGDACNANGDTHAFLWKAGQPMVDLGPPTPPEVFSQSAAVAINASGVVTGYADDSTGHFIFESSGDGTPMTRIYQGLGGDSFVTSPYAINDRGQLTGNADAADGFEHAFIWKNDGSPMLDLGTLAGFNSANGLAINASGQVAGVAYRPGSSVTHGFVWKNDGTRMLDLGTLGGNFSDADYINASGEVAGESYLPGNKTQHAFVWKNDGTPMQDLGTLGGPFSSATALNDAGQIAGNSYPSGLHTVHAYVLLNDGTPMKDLGTLGGSSSEALGMNSSGQVTGDSFVAGDAGIEAFLWRNDGTKMQDLNTLIDPTDPLKPYVILIAGDFINDSGDIVAEGYDSRRQGYHPYLLQGTVLTLNPRSLAFGDQPIGKASAAKSVTVTNTSPKAEAITSIALTGAAAGQFTTTNNCGKSMASHATCTIKVTFKPTTKGAKSESLNVNGGGGGLRVVTVMGTGK